MKLANKADRVREWPDRTELMKKTHTLNSVWGNFTFNIYSEVTDALRDYVKRT